MEQGPLRDDDHVEAGGAQRARGASQGTLLAASEAGPRLHPFRLQFGPEGLISRIARRMGRKAFHGGGAGGMPEVSGPTQTIRADRGTSRSPVSVAQGRLSGGSDMAFRGQKTLLDETRQGSLVRWAVKTAMVNEFTGAAAEQKYFTEAERLAFRDSYAIPANLWIWLARYDGVLPLHSLQIRAPKTADKRPTLYSLTFGSNFFVMQVFACREDRFCRVAEATQGSRLQQVYPSPSAWISWPPETTIDDAELQVLDYRFARVIGGTVE